MKAQSILVTLNNHHGETAVTNLGIISDDEAIEASKKIIDRLHRDFDFYFKVYQFYADGTMKEIWCDDEDLAPYDIIDIGGYSWIMEGN